MESAPIFRRWAAITTIAAALEQKVWLETTAPLYPNLYCFLVGHPGVGKSRTVSAAGALVRDLSDFHLAPTSMTMASLVDALVEAKRTVIQVPHPAVEFNSMYIMADELSAFMHKFDEELIGGLTTFYDVNVPYAQNRRGKDIKIKIKRPQLSILSGTTPSNLIKFVPEFAWDQGFTSRVILVFSDERPMVDDFFAPQKRSVPEEMIQDLRVIHSLMGKFRVSDEFKSAFNNWRKLGEPPVPSHPKLLHYATRRRAHLLKLSMVAAVDRSNALILDKAAFNTAMGWLIEAEDTMPDVFKAGAVGADAKAQDEAIHFVQVKGTVKEHQLVNFLRERIPAHAVLRTIEVMEKAGMIKAVDADKYGVRTFALIKPSAGSEEMGTLQ